MNEEIRLRTRVVGAVRLEPDEHWQLEGWRTFFTKSMAAIMALADHAAL